MIIISLSLNHNFYQSTLDKRDVYTLRIQQNKISEYIKNFFQMFWLVTANLMDHTLCKLDF